MAKHASDTDTWTVIGGKASAAAAGMLAWPRQHWSRRPGAPSALLPLHRPPTAQVYDLSEWIGVHPGGPAAIKSLAGVDGTARFTAQHGPPEGDSVQARMLAGFQIGTLKTI